MQLTFKKHPATIFKTSFVYDRLLLILCDKDDEFETPFFLVHMWNSRAIFKKLDASNKNNHNGSQPHQRHKEEQLVNQAVVIPGLTDSSFGIKVFFLILVVLKKSTVV